MNPAPRDKKLYFYCNEEEAVLIHQLALKNQRSVSGYLREVALQGSVILINYDAIRAHTRELSLVKAQINDIVRLFVKTNGVYQSDIEELISLLKEIRDSENELLKKFNSHVSTIRKKVMKAIMKNLFLK